MSGSEVTPTGGGTIVMTTFNRADRAAAAVERLLELPEAWPVIVVDDASTDGTSATLRQWFDLEIRRGRVEVISSERNLGAASRTAGVHAATTELVAFCDDDSWWAPGSLAEAMSLFTRHERLGLIAATVLVEPSGQPDPIVEQLASSPLPSEDPGPSVLGFLACGAVVRRRAYLEVGGFNPLFHIGGEEELLALDLRAAGWRVVHVRSVVAHHEPDRDDAGRAGRSVRLATNHLLVQWLRRPLRAAVGSTLVAAARGVTQQTDRRAVLATIGMLPTLIRERRVLPRPVESDVRRLEPRSTP